MTDTPNVLTDMRGTQIPGADLAVGDVALVLKKDGSVQAINFGYDARRLLQPNESMTEDDKAMQKQGQRLFALALAAQNPQIMDMLLAIATDPEVINFDALKGMARMH